MKFSGITSINQLLKKAEEKETSGVGSFIGGAAGAVLGQFIPIPIIDDLLLSWLGSKTGDWIEQQFRKPTTKEEAEANLEKAKRLYQEEIKK